MGFGATPKGHPAAPKTFVFQLLRRQSRQSSWKTKYHLEGLRPSKPPKSESPIENRR